MNYLNNMKNYLKTGVSINLIIAVSLVSVCANQSFALNATEKTITLALTSEPPNLDSTKATDSESFFIIGHSMEGLTRYSSDGKIVPAIAEKWAINDKTATFTLRKNAKWSDGSAVTARDFVFSWRTALDPKTASEYSFILYHIKNAEEINKGNKPLSELGVVAKDDHTLVVTFEKPCGYFLALTTFPTYMPIKEEFYVAQKGKYAANADNLLTNGPFKLQKWVHGASLRLEKNEHYWDTKRIQISAIDIPYITPDDGARFNLFKTSKIDVLGLSKDNLQNAQREQFKLSKFQDGTVFFLRFNFREGHATANKNLRKAISLVFNSSEYLSKVIGIPGTAAARGLVPSYMMGTKQAFRKEFPITEQKANIAEAKKLVALAKAELGPKLSSLVFLTGDSPTASKEADYFQNVFKTVLGIDLKIDKQIFKQRLAKATAGEFDIEAAAWGPDYADPMTFVDLFSTWNNNNNGLWKNAKYDEFVKKAINSADAKIRMTAMADAEKILMEELPIITTYERTIMFTHSPKIEGIVRRAVGFDPDYTNAVIK